MCVLTHDFLTKLKMTILWIQRFFFSPRIHESHHFVNRLKRQPIQLKNGWKSSRLHFLKYNFCVRVFFSVQYCLNTRSWTTSVRCSQLQQRAAQKMMYRGWIQIRFVWTFGMGWTFLSGSDYQWSLSEQIWGHRDSGWIIIRPGYDMSCFSAIL